MKILFKFTLVVAFYGIILFPARATYSSLYVFGDALSSTTDNTPGSDYYGKRFSNGRVWVEVLAQRQGLVYDASKNNSYYDHNSSNLVVELKTFSAPPNPANALFVVWVCNADTFDASSWHLTAAQWTTAIKQAQTNHLQIITNLYAKGVRNLVLPNAVDISKIPAYNQSTFTNTMRNGCIAYNLAFSNTINQARLLCPGLKIIAPDFFTLLNNVLTNAASYGLTNALANGYSIDASSAYNYGYPHATTNGFGTNFVYWDYMNPTAKFHAVIADVAQQLISPVQISQLTVLSGSNRLDVVNVPVGLNGFVDGITNLASAIWTPVQNFSSVNTNQAIVILTTNSTPTNIIIPMGLWPPGEGGTPVVIALEFYRLRFPYSWSWP